MRHTPRYADWGPPTQLDVLMEDNLREHQERMKRDLSVFMYARQHIVLPYQTPIYVLRRRAMYGGKKGRAAIKRMRAAGVRPKWERFSFVLT